VSSVWITESDLWAWLWLLCLSNPMYTSTMCYWHPPVQKIKKLPNLIYFKPRLFKRKIHPPWKVSLFVGHGVSHRRDNKSYLKFYMRKVVFLIYRMMPIMLGFDGWIVDFGVTGISRHFGAKGGVQRSVKHRHILGLASFDRYTFYLVSCKIWWWGLHLGFEKQGNLLQNFATGNRKVSKNVK
jgi:hypothetical protein